MHTIRHGAALATMPFRKLASTCLLTEMTTELTEAHVHANYFLEARDAITETATE